MAGKNAFVAGVLDRSHIRCITDDLTTRLLSGMIKESLSFPYLSGPNCASGEQTIVQRLQNIVNRDWSGVGQHCTGTTYFEAALRLQTGAIVSYGAQLSAEWTPQKGWELRRKDITRADPSRFYNLHGTFRCQLGLMANNPYCYERAFVRPKRISVAATRQYFSGTVASVTRTRQNQKYEQKVNPAQGTVRGEARPGCANPSVRGYPQQHEREIQHPNHELRCCAAVLPSRGRQCRPSQLMDSAKRGQPAQPVYGNQRINKTMSNDSNQEWGYEQRTACSGQSRQCCDRNEFLRHARNGGPTPLLSHQVSWP